MVRTDSSDRHARGQADGLVGRAGPPVVAAQLTALAAALITASTLLALLAESWWVAELFSHFRIQYAIAGGVLLLVSVGLRRHVLTLALSAVIVVNAAAAANYLRAPAAARAYAEGASIAGEEAGDVSGVRATSAIADSHAVRILSANILAYNADPRRLIELLRIEAPDVVLVMENSAAFAASFSALHDTFPYRVRSEELGPFGIALYSRLPFIEAAVVPLGPTAAVQATIATPGDPVQLLGVHLLPPTGAERAAARNLQLLQIAERVGKLAANTIVCGDFNLTPYSPYFAQLVAATGLTPARPQGRLPWTWPAGFLPFGVPIDHCFTGSGIGVVNAEVLGDIGSDHYPLRIDIIAGSKR